MSRCYLDTSAAAKLLVEEDETDVLAVWLDETDHVLVATHLLETELRRFVIRHGIPQADASAVLERVELYGLPPSLYREAGVLPDPTLRSLDALHLAAAIRLDVDTIATYDTRFAAAAEDLGLRVDSPGVSAT